MPIPPLEEWVRQRAAHYDTAYVSSDPHFAHAHITLLGPFVHEGRLTAEVSDRVGAVLSRQAPFVVRLGEVGVFPDGTIYLSPEPAKSLCRLTDDLVEAFPGYPPYGGAYRVRPHLTLDRVGPRVDVESVRASVSDLVPVNVEVGEASLSWYEQDACREITRWALSGVAVPGRRRDRGDGQ